MKDKENNQTKSLEQREDSKQKFNKDFRGKRSKPKRYVEKPSDNKIGFPGNDFSWWNKVPELVRDSANFKSNYIPGRAVSGNDIPKVFPGVLTVILSTNYMPGNSPTDPINVWARDLYLRMFQKYRPANNYSASDLGIAILAGIEAVKLIATYERIYGVINRYSALNVNMPTVEAAALGLTSTQLTYLQTHLSDFRYDLNYLIKKAQRLCIPKDISFIADTISLLGCEYLDHDSKKAQIIVFREHTAGIYSDTRLSTGGSIAFGVINTLFDFNRDNMCLALENVLNPLLGSDSIQRIYADLVVWFGESAMLQFVPVPEDYIVVPVYAQSILHKFHNIEQAPRDVSNYNVSVGKTWVNNALSAADKAALVNMGYCIYQCNDSIHTIKTFVAASSSTPTTSSYTINNISGYVFVQPSSLCGLTSNHIIDGYDIEVTPEFVVEGSLFKLGLDTNPDEEYAVTTTCVNWDVVDIELFTVNVSSPTHVELNTDDLTVAMAAAAHLTLFDWAPLATASSFSSGIVNDIYGDVDTLIPVRSPELEKVQRSCFLSGLFTDVKPVV